MIRKLGFRSERGTLDEFHHQRTHTPRGFQAVNVRDVRVIQRGEDLGFALKARQAIRIRREEIRQDFQGDVAVEVPIAGAVHLTL